MSDALAFGLNKRKEEVSKGGRMANEEQLRLLKQGVNKWNAWRQEKENQKIYIDLCWADLRGADLRRVILDRADLYKAKLDGAFLCNADLHEAYLRGAHLTGADLTEANLRRANLRGASLRRTRRRYLTKPSFAGLSHEANLARPTCL
jgi:uncharacterized protein YjbI with pentapeptide repeats